MRRFIQWLVVIAVLCTAVWFLAWWAAGSSKGRGTAERRLGRVLDMEVRVAATRLEWPFTLVIEGVEGQIPSGNTRNADLHIQEIRLSPICARHAEIRRPSIRMLSNGGWDWQPAMLRSLVLQNADTGPAEEVFDRVARAIDTRWSFELSNTTILRRDTDGEDQPVFGGLSWTSYPVKLAGHGRVTHNMVSFQSRGGEHVGGDGLESIEWISLQGYPPLRLWKTEDKIQAPQPETASPSPTATPAGKDGDKAKEGASAPRSDKAKTDEPAKDNSDDKPTAKDDSRDAEGAA